MWFQTGSWYDQPSYNGIQKSIYILTCIKLSKNKWQSCRSFQIQYNLNDHDWKKNWCTSRFNLKKIRMIYE